MKTFTLSIIALAAGLMSFTSQAPYAGPKPAVVASFATTSILWKTTEINLGEIPQNVPANITYEFTNTGNAPVLITHVQPGCGCTNAQYDKEAIQPGKSTKISATFNAAVKGPFSKTITVTTNAEEAPRVLTFKGTVI